MQTIDVVLILPQDGDNALTDDDYDIRLGELLVSHIRHQQYKVLPTINKI